MRMILLLLLCFLVVSCGANQGYRYRFESSASDIAAEIDSLYEQDTTLIVQYQAKKYEDSIWINYIENPNDQDSSAYYYWFNIRCEDRQRVMCIRVKKPSVSWHEKYTIVYLRLWADELKGICPLNSHIFCVEKEYKKEEQEYIRLFEEQVLNRLLRQKYSKD